MDTDIKSLSTIILAAGKGTRMKSDLAKVLHRINGRPMLAYSVDLASRMGSQKTVVVIGHQAALIRETFSGHPLIFVEQHEQLGTGHAVLQAKEAFRGYQGTILILCGDVPLLRKSTISALYDGHLEKKSAVTVMTTILQDPGNYGRVVTGADGQVMKIVEQRDATEEEKKIREINTGIYCADSSFLFDAVGRIRNDNAQHEYYLTDIIEIARLGGLRAGSYIASDPLEVMGINTTQELDTAARCMASR